MKEMDAKKPSDLTMFLADVQEVGTAIAVGLQRLSRTLEPVLERLRNPSPETIEVIKGLLILAHLHEKYNGDQKAILRAMVERQLGRKADALLVTKIQDVRRKPLSEFVALVNHHNLRLGREEVPERVKAVRGGIRMYASLEEARSILAEHYKWGRERVVLDAIEEAVCEQRASESSDTDLVRAATNRLRRDATQRRKDLSTGFTNAGASEELGVERSQNQNDPEIETRETLLFLQQLADTAARQKPLSQQELESFVIAAYMTHTEASPVLGRSVDQIKQERLRARGKLRRAAGGSSS